MKFFLKSIFPVIFLIAIFSLFGFVHPPYAQAAGCDDPVNVNVDWFLSHCMQSGSYYSEDPQGTALALAARLNSIVYDYYVYWSVIPNGDGSFTVACSNHSVNIRFYGPPGATPPQPQIPPACNQNCNNDQECSQFYDSSDGCTKCVLNQTPPQGGCPAGYHEVPAGTTEGGSSNGGPVPTLANGNSCSINISRGVCKIPPTVTVTPPACGTPCTQSGDCAGAALNCTSCVANHCTVSPTPIPQCGTPCTQSGDCAGAALNCTSCVANHCAVSPTPIPQCGTPCTQSGNCNGAALNCTSCVANHCAVSPTPIPQCGTPCTQSGNCAGASLNCTVCTQNRCSAPPTATPTLTPTPVPPLPECDKIEYTPFTSGQNTTITSYAKVEGPNAKSMLITSQNFYLTEGGDDEFGQKILSSGPITATPVITSPTLYRYKSVWTFKFPTLTSGKTYRIWSSINYHPVTAFGSSSVAGAHTQQKLPLFAKIATFVKKLLGIKEKVNYVVVSPTPVKIVANPTGASVMGTTSQVASLQLDTINPIEVYNKGCHSISFRYNF